MKRYLVSTTASVLLLLTPGSPLLVHPSLHSNPHRKPAAHLSCSNGGIPAESANKHQWDAFAHHQAKRWFGVWSTHDAEGMLMDEVDLDTDLRLSADGQEIEHVNTLYGGSIKSDCERCHDSVDTREVCVGTYTPDTLRQIACGPAYLSGPSVSRRGALTTEIGLSRPDFRVRCIVIHAIPDDQLQGIDPPTSLRLDRIVLVRENLKSHPIRGYKASEVVWAEPEPTRLLGLWRGKRQTLVPSPGLPKIEWGEENVAPTHLRKCRCSGAGDEGEEGVARLDFQGGIRLEAPRQVLAGEPTSLALSWLPKGGGEQHSVLRGEVGFRALGRVKDTVYSKGGMQQVVISPPEMLRFDVEELEPVASAGLP
ncbi:unnamed protein product [Discosporangium mesarthrocarpum]